MLLPPVQSGNGTLPTEFLRCAGRTLVVEIFGVWAGSSVVEHLTFNQVVDGSIPSRLTKYQGPSDIFQRPYFSGCHLRTAWIGGIFDRHFLKAIFIDGYADDCARLFINGAPVKCSAIHFTESFKTLVLLFLDQN